MNLLNKHIPKQYVGFKTSTTAVINCQSKEAAQKVMEQAKKRLLAINNWFEIAGSKGAKFQLTDKDGKEIRSITPEIGNLIRIKLPAPPNTKGNGYDWVRIEKFEDEALVDECIYGFCVRPVKNPNDNSNQSAHFYTSNATSSFLIYRKLNKVYAFERGRNEVPNPTGTFLNKVRNLLVAIPAMLGFSKPQWKNLVNGILNGQ